MEATDVETASQLYNKYPGGFLGQIRERTLKAPTEKPILAFALIGQYYLILALIML